MAKKIIVHLPTTKPYSNVEFSLKNSDYEYTYVLYEDDDDYFTLTPTNEQLSTLVGTVTLSAKIYYTDSTQEEVEIAKFSFAKSGFNYVIKQSVSIDINVVDEEESEE